MIKAYDLKSPKAKRYIAISFHNLARIWHIQWRINLTGQVLFFILQVEWSALNERSCDMSERLDGQIYSLIYISSYKITKIVRALWLAERPVCMRVCKHGCDANLFGFARANHASTNLKTVLSWKTRQVDFIYPFPRRLKLGKSLETCCVNFFSLELTF